MTIRVALVDDHALVRAAFRFMLASFGDIEVVAEGGTGEDALRIARELKPDVILLDVSMPGMSGIEVTQRLVKSGSKVRIAIVTMHGDGPLPKMLLGVGASAFLTKDCSADEMIRAIRSIERGGRYVAEVIAQRMALANASGNASPLDSLTPREFEVALMLGRGDRPVDIGNRLHISEKTVHTYKTRIYAKTSVRNEAELTLLLVRNGLLTEM